MPTKRTKPSETFREQPCASCAPRAAAQPPPFPFSAMAPACAWALPGDLRARTRAVPVSVSLAQLVEHELDTGSFPGAYVVVDEPLFPRRAQRLGTAEPVYRVCRIAPTNPGALQLVCVRLQMRPPDKAGSMGSSRMRFPVAANRAEPMEGAVAVMGDSPAPAEGMSR